MKAKIKFITAGLLIVCLGGMAKAQTGAYSIGAKNKINRLLADGDTGMSTINVNCSLKCSQLITSLENQISNN